MNLLTDPRTDYSRGRNNDISKLMNDKVKHTKEQTYANILWLINGERCSMEIAELLEKDLHKISGRFSELKAQNKIIATTRKNYKGSVYAVFDIV